MKKHLLFSAVFMLLSCFSWAQWQQLNDSLLTGIEENGMVYTGTAVLAATQGGVYRSADNGMSWQSSNAGLDLTNMDQLALAYYNDVLYVAGDKLYHSDDDGLSWVAVDLGMAMDGSVRDLVTTKEMLFVLYQYHNMGADSLFVCYSSDGISWDKGALVYEDSQWQEWRFLNGQANKAVLISESEHVLLYTMDGMALDTIHMDGLNGEPSLWEGNFAMDTSGMHLLFTDEDNAMVYKYDFGGEIWDASGAGLMPGMAGVSGPHFVDTVAFVSAFYFGLELSLDLYRSYDYGENWTKVSEPGVDFPMFDGTMLRVADGRLISSNFLNDMMYSDDNGDTWLMNYHIFANAMNNMVVTDNGHIYVIKGEKGILRSDDYGVSWEVHNGDLPDFQSLYFVDKLLPHENMMYASVRSNPFSEKDTIYKNSDMGQTWVPIAAPDSAQKKLITMNGNMLMVHFADRNDDGTIQYTSDMGGNWVDISAGINNLNLNEVFSFTGNGDTLFMFAQNGEFKQKLYMSLDDGGSWMDVTYNLTDMYHEIVITNQYDDNMRKPLAAFDEMGNNLVVVTKQYQEQGVKLYLHEMNAAKDAWRIIDSVHLTGHSYDGFYSLQHVHGLWYLTTCHGVWVYLNGAFEPVWEHEGLTPGIRNIAVVIREQNFLLGTLGNGIWKTVVAAPEITTKTATSITDTSALSGGDLVSTGGFPVTAMGVVYGMEPLPDLDDTMLEQEEYMVSFTKAMTDLSANTTYYVRAYAVNVVDTTYGNQVQFGTDFSENIEDVLSAGEFSVYPNPVAEKLTIEGRNGQILQIKLYDVLGVLVNEWEYAGAANYEVNMDGLKPGLYILQLKAGDQLQTIKLHKL